MLRGLTAAACFGLAASAFAAGSVKLDSVLPYYETGSRVSGTIKSVGSDTMDTLMTQWAERFERYYRKASVEIDSAGAGYAMPALIEGVAQFAPMARDANADEIEGFEDRYGYEPLQLRTAFDTMAIFVHKDNPIEGLSLDQIEQIFSVNGADITWGDLGLTGEWADQPVSLYGRNTTSGASDFFQSVALNGAEFKPGVKALPDSDAMVQSIANDKYALGYSGLGYASAEVRAIPLAVDAGEEFVPPNVETANNGEYPLTRNLYLTINHRAGSTMLPRHAEFIKLIYSKQGQEIVLNNGFFPVSAETAREELLNAGISID